MRRRGLTESAAENIHEGPTRNTKTAGPRQRNFVITNIGPVSVGLMCWPYRQKVGQLQPSRTCRKVISEK